MKYGIIQHLDEIFDPADYPAEVLAERVDLVEIEIPGSDNCFLISISYRTKDGISDKDYVAFDNLKEANDWLDTMGYDILK